MAVTRSRGDSRKELENYFQSEEFDSIINKTLTVQFEKFIASSEFKNMLVTTTKAVVSDVVQGTVQNIIDKEILAIVEPLKKQIDCLFDELANTKIHANENEQYSQRCNVRIHGIPEVESENCYEVVLDFFRKDLRCEVNESEIDRTHRVGKRQAGYKPRAIIVKFCSYQSKAKVMKSKTILKGKPLFVNEDLTAVNKRLFDVARRELRPLPVWSSDGKILVKLQNERVVRVKSEGDIKRYIIM